MGHPEDAQTGAAVIQPSQMHKLQVKHLLTDPMSEKTGLSAYPKLLIFTCLRSTCPAERHQVPASETELRLQS